MLETVLTVVWEFANSAIGVTLVAGALLWALNKIYFHYPKWQNYEGALIRAVQWAEKEIPDDVENKHLHRADLALQYALKLYEEIEGRRADDRMTAQLKQGLEVVHLEMEASGALDSAKGAAEAV